MICWLGAAFAVAQQSKLWFTVSPNIQLESCKTNFAWCRNSEISQLAFLFILFPSATRVMCCSPARSGFSYLSSSYHWPVPLTSLCPSWWDSCPFHTHAYNKVLQGNMFIWFFSCSLTCIHLSNPKNLSKNLMNFPLSSSVHSVGLCSRIYLKVHVFNI